MAMNVGFIWWHKRNRKIREARMPRKCVWFVRPDNKGMGCLWWPEIEKDFPDITHFKSPIYRDRIIVNGKQQSKALIELNLKTDLSWKHDNDSTKLFVSLFAISNEVNYVLEDNDDEDIIKGKPNWIIIKPFQGAKSWWSNDYGIIAESNSIMDRGFIDRTSKPQRGVSWTMANGLWALSKESGNVWNSGYSWDHARALSNLWYIETNLINWSVKEEITTNQTHNVKFWTARRS